MDIKERIEYLVDKLNYYTKKYDEGEMLITDQEWDAMYFELYRLEQEYNIYLPTSPTQVISYQVVNALNKVKHNHPMLSLAKTKDWNEFVQYFGDKSVVGMIKVDGLTCSLRYLNGRLVSAETRGNGVEGEDILHNALVIPSIPKRIDYEDELIIDGEIICSTKDFEEFKEEFANPRNFAAGSIRLLDSRECAKRKLKFIAWHVVSHNWDTIITSLGNLQRLGFSVVPWINGIDDWDAKEFLINAAKEEDIPIDGLVGRFNDIAYGESLGATGHHSRAAYAFKFYDETYTSYLLDIEYTMGRTGILTPVGIFEPIEIEGSVCERASLHNLSIMKERLGTPYEGQTVEIYRANMIIPQIASAGIPESKADIEGIAFEIPKVCPVCGDSLTIICEIDSEVLYCSNPQCEGKLINKLDHFCGKKGLDIKGLSKATLERLVNWGWVNQPADLYTLKEHENEWVNKQGFGVKSVSNILTAIENSKTPKLEQFISALGIPMIGLTISKELVKYIDDYNDFKNKAKNKWDFSIIDGIAYEKLSSIWKFNFDEADAVSQHMLGYIKEDNSNSEQSLKDQIVCITGRLTVFKNRSALQKEIEKRGGKVTAAVSRNTNWLINNDVESMSAKNIEAKKLNIPIVSEKEFFNLFLDN